MSRHCPACGSEVELEPKSVEVEGGTCPDCAHTFVVLPPISGLTSAHVVTGAPGPAAGGAEGAAPESDGEDDEEELAAVCAECGGPLILSVDDENALAATCDECETEFKLVRADAPASVAAARPVPSDEGRSFGPRGGRDRGESFPPSRARPCRKCGGPIVFSDSPDGGMTGTCQSCGNQFQLRPRAEGGDRGFGGGGGRGYGGGGRGRGPPPWSRGGGRGPPRFNSRGPPRGGGGRWRDNDRSSDDDDRRRRRRRDD